MNSPYPLILQNCLVKLTPLENTLSPLPCPDRYYSRSSTPCPSSHLSPYPLYSSPRFFLSTPTHLFSGIVPATHIHTALLPYRGPIPYRRILPIQQRGNWTILYCIMWRGNRIPNSDITQTVNTPSISDRDCWSNCQLKSRQHAEPTASRLAKIIATHWNGNHTKWMVSGIKIPPWGGFHLLSLSSCAVCDRSPKPRKLSLVRHNANNKKAISTTRYY